MTATTEIEFRPIAAGDGEFLLEVYASTRDDVAAAMLDGAEKSQFLQMQFNAQHQYYQATFPDARYQIILFDDVPVGRLYVDRPGNEIHVIDIALLPRYRRQGIGTRLMSDILEEAARTHLPVRIYVEHYNSALSWYEKLGFVMVEDLQTHYQMQWRSSPATASE